MEKLKKAFDAARVFRGHYLDEAASELGVSKTMLIKFFKGEATSAPLEKRVRRYITTTGIIKSIRDLGLDPSTPVNKVATPSQ